MPPADEYESEFQTRFMLAMGRDPRWRVWRQNAGKVVCVDKSGHRRSVVLAPTGAADLSGIVRGSGRRLEIEVKRNAKSKRRQGQETWAEMIRSMGGVCCLVHGGMTVEHAVDVVAEACLA